MLTGAWTAEVVPQPYSKKERPVSQDSDVSSLNWILPIGLHLYLNEVALKSSFLPLKGVLASVESGVSAWLLAKLQSPLSSTTR